MNIIITEDLIALAAQYGACDKGLEQARAHIGEDACDVLRSAKLEWVAQNLPLPNAIAEEMERRGYGRSWWHNGKLHRDDGPAVVYPKVGFEWYRDGKLHRDDGPAVQHPGGSVEWWHNGLLHREGSPAVESPSGRREWYRNGKLHRDDGPAVEWPDGTGDWYHHGQRIDPPKGDTHERLACTSSSPRS